MNNAILDDAGNIVLTSDIIAWAKWFETADRHVGKTEVGDSVVSTVFLGVDHSFSAGGPPLWYETMIFGKGFEDEQWRYSTKEEAQEGHRKPLHWSKRLCKVPALKPSNPSAKLYAGTMRPA